MAEGGERRDPSSHRTPGQIKRMDRGYNARPEHVDRRVKDKIARREYEEKHGDLPSNVDVDHIKPHREGGSNKPSNTRALHQSRNRGWADGKR